MKKHESYIRPGDATACETELADYIEMLVSYMMQYHERGEGGLLWDLFKEDYPTIANELAEWMKTRHRIKTKSAAIGGYQPIDTGNPAVPPGNE